MNKFVPTKRKGVEVRDIDSNNSFDNIKPEINWENTLVFEPMFKEVHLSETLTEKIGKLALEGATDEEICLFCNFNTKAWKNYLRLHENFNDWLKRLRKKTSYLARKNIAEVVEEGNLAYSKWWLERDDKRNKCANFGVENEADANLSVDDEEILEAYVTKTITLKQTAKIPLSKALKPVTATENN